MPTARAKASRAWLFSVRKYDRLAALGWFRDQRVELVNGRILRMAPQAEPHTVAILLAERALRATFDSGFHIRTQMPLHLGKYSKPEPDVAIVAGDVRESLRAGTPTTAALVVEVSDSTLRYDRGIKASLYAKFGISDYWIVNLVNRQLEVHRNPLADPTHQFGFRYARIDVKNHGDSVSPFAKAQAFVRVADLLP